MGRRKRSTKRGSKKVVQLFNSDIELGVLPQPLPQTALDILGVLGADGVAAQAAIIAGVSKSDVSYWVKRFIKAGALILRTSQDPRTLGKPKKLQRYSAGKPKYYDLTPYGSKLLTGSEGVLRLPVVLEDHAVKFRVLCWERVGSIDWEKLGEPRNWVKLGFRVSGVRVVRTSRSVIVHPGPLKGFDVDTLEVDAGRIVERVRYVLEVKFGMQFADDPVHLHKPRWQVYRPEAREWVKVGTCEVKGIGALDHSPKPTKGRDPLHKQPHLEYSDKRLASTAAAFPVASDPSKQLVTAAVNFPLALWNLEREIPLMTESFRRLELTVSGLKDDLKTVSKGYESLVKVTDSLVDATDSLRKIRDVLGRIFNLEAEQEAPKPGSMREYVS